MNTPKYIRVATTLYKIVRKPLQSGDIIEIRIPWNYDTLRQDHTKDFMSTIEKYDGFNFRSQFNSDWATKLIVAVDEVLLDRKDDSERIKNLSTAKSYKAEAKGKDRNEVEFFAKFILCSNNELNPICIEYGETRYWVRKIPTISSENTNLLGEMKRELPCFLYHLLHRQLSTSNESRMWFRQDLLITAALRQIVNHNRSKVESEMLQLIAEIIQFEQLVSISFCIGEIVIMLEIRGVHTEHSQVRKILQHNWEMKPKEPTLYTSYLLSYDGNIETLPKIGRCYTATKSQIDFIMLIC